MYYEEILPQFSQMLKNLLGILDKAGAYADTKKFDVKNLLTARLAPDQFPFIKQVQIVTDTAKGITARLAGQEPPKWEDNEQTLAEVKARVQKAIDFLATFKADQFKDPAKLTIPVSFMPGKALSGADFLKRMSIPNFYFHLTTAYAILRHNGVDLGKADYLGPIDFKTL